MIDRRFVVTATGGEVIADQGGALDVAGTSFIIPDTSVKPDTPAIVRVKAAGSVTSVLSLLNRPPLSVLKETPLPVDLADGQASLTGTLALPMKPKVPFELLEFHLDGEIRDIASSVLVPGQTITAQSMTLSGTQDGIALSGNGFIGSVPVTARWSQPLGKDVPKASRLDGTVELSPKLIDTFEIGLPENSVSGKGPAQFALEFAQGQQPRLRLSSDLRGVGLSLDALGWSKPQSASGTLEISGQLGERTSIDRIVLNGAGLSANGAITTNADGGLDRALFSSVRMGNWLDASVELQGKGRGAAPDVRVLSGTLDMRSASFGSSGQNKDQSSNALNISLDRLQVSDGISLTDFRGQFQTSGGLRGPFQGKVNGQTAITGEVRPQSGRSAFRIRSNDAGGVVRSAGLLSMARGGSFDMSLLPGARRASLMENWKSNRRAFTMHRQSRRC